MRHISIGIVFVISIVLGNATSTHTVQAKSEKNTLWEKHDDYYDAFLVLLNPYANKAI